MQWKEARLRWWPDQSLWVSGFAVPRSGQVSGVAFTPGQAEFWWEWRQARESLEKERGGLWPAGTWGTEGPSGNLLRNIDAYPRDLTCWATGVGAWGM